MLAEIVYILAMVFLVLAIPVALAVLGILEITWDGHNVLCRGCDRCEKYPGMNAPKQCDNCKAYTYSNIHQCVWCGRDFP